MVNLEKILVTGGAGFIGSHLVDAYLSQGFQVVAVDNLSTGRIENVNPQARFYPVDITSFADLATVFKEEQPDYLNHHAAQINLRRSVEEPVFDGRINILGSLNLLELSRQFGVKKFIFASTGGAIYGEVDNLPVGEDTPALPLSPYGVAKRSVELYLNYYHQIWGLDYVALRYGNVYGPRQDPTGEAGVIAIFCGRILKNQPCLVFGQGNKTRDYVFVEDVARANLLALQAACGIYNIGTGKETSVLDLIELFRKASGKKEIPVQFEPEKKGEINRIALSSRLAREKLNWFPQTPITEGLTKTYKWFAQKEKGE